MATHGIIQGSVYRAESGALYEIKSRFFEGDAVQCPACGKDAPLARLRESGACPACGKPL